MIRLKTGIPGMDELIEGGFPEASSILVAGGPGTGKSIFSLEYLYYGAKDYGEPGAYVTLEEGAHNIWWNMQRFKWDLMPLERDNKLKIFKFEPDLNIKEDIEGQTKRIVEKAKEMGAKRLVIDSVTALSFWIDDVAKIRYAIYVLIEELRKLNATTILTCETLGGKNESSRFGVEDFLTDGVLVMSYRPPHRFLYVKKMRGTKHSLGIHPLEITPEGIRVNDKEEVSWEAMSD